MLRADLLQAAREEFARAESDDPWGLAAYGERTLALHLIARDRDQGWRTSESLLTGHHPRVGAIRWSVGPFLSALPDAGRSKAATASAIKDLVAVTRQDGCPPGLPAATVLWSGDPQESVRFLRQRHGDLGDGNWGATEAHQMIGVLKALIMSAP